MNRSSTRRLSAIHCLIAICIAPGSLAQEQPSATAASLEVTQIQPLPVIGTTRTQPVVFALTVDAQCADGTAIGQTTTNIADATLTRTLSELADPRAEMPINPDQLVGLNTTTLCARRNTSAAPVWILEDAFSAQTALHCTEGDNMTVVYAATPLSVTVDCGANASADVAPESQTSESRPARPQPRQNADRPD